MSKVFGYPEFDDKGEMILTTYDNEYKAMMMDIRVYRMKAGEVRKFKRDGEETAVLLLSGDLNFAWEDKKETVTRKDVFTEGPWCVHVSTGVEVEVTANAETEILVQCTHNDKTFASRLYAPKQEYLRDMGALGNHAGLVGYGEHYNNQFVNQSMTCVVFE